MATEPFNRRPSDSKRMAVNLRARAYINTAVERTYHMALHRWAREDDAPFPDRAQIRGQLESELLTLCRGLGSWAAAQPDDILGPIPRPRRDDDIDSWW